LASRELRQPDELAEPLPELRLERGDRQEAPVSGRVDAIAGDASREQPRHLLTVDAVRDQILRAVRHRNGEPCASALEQRREDLRDRTERSGCEIRDLHGRHRRRRVRERARPAEVIEVVAGPLLVPAADAETCDRAVDRVRARVVRADAEPCRDARAESLEHDVAARDERAR
jgi:hypothetical protein